MIWWTVKKLRLVYSASNEWRSFERTKCYKQKNFSRRLEVIITTLTLCQTVVLNTLVVAQTVWKHTLEISWLTTQLKYVCWPNLNFPGCTAVFKLNRLRWRQHAASLWWSIHYLIIYFFSIKFSFRELNEQNVD